MPTSTGYSITISPTGGVGGVAPSKATESTFKVGDEVEYELLNINNKGWIPRWDYSLDRNNKKLPSSNIFIPAVVIFSDSSSITIKIIGKKDIQWTWPYIEEKTRAIRPGWLRHKQGESTKIESSKEFIHTEFININKGQFAPALIIEKAIDRGERAVRRNTRTWPFGKVLKYQETKTDISIKYEWYWENEPEKK